MGKKDIYYPDIIEKKDKLLLRLALSEKPSQEKLDELLAEWDIEKEGGQKSLLLSYVEESCPELSFPAYTGPRLRGLLKYYRFSNVKLMSRFKSICTELRANGIDLMPIKGGAMKALRPSLPRQMNDIDILVRKADFRKAVKVVRGMGYDCSIDIHSADVHEAGSEEGILDIHHSILTTSMKGGRLCEGMFDRSSAAQVFGVDCALPCKEDLLFINLTNLSRNIMDKTCLGGIPFSLFDLHYLVNTDNSFDWNIVKNDAMESASKAEVSYVSKLVNTLVPGLLPAEMEELADLDELYSMSKLAEFRRTVLEPLQRKRQLNGFNPIYTALKLFRYSPAFAAKAMSAISKQK